MELNAEKIKKDLECCVSGNNCTLCPYIEENGCASMLIETALSLINELIEENERLREHNINLEQKLMLLGIEDVYVFKAKVKGE